MAFRFHFRRKILSKYEDAAPVIDLWFGDYPQGFGHPNIRASTGYGPGKVAGWEGSGKRNNRFRDYGGVRYPGFVLSFTPATLVVDVPAGQYKCTLVCGDTDFEDHRTVVHVEGTDTPIPLIKGRRFEFTVTEFGAVAGQNGLRLSFDSPNNNWIINHLRVEPAVEEVAVTQYISYPDAWPSFDESTLEFSRLHKMALACAEKDAPLNPTGRSRADYLDGVRGIVGFFGALQAPGGAIIDPNKKEEFQYSTPAYAYCSSLLLAEGNDPDIKGSAIRAIDWSISTFCQGKAATKHEDFFPFFLGQALRLIEPFVDASQMEGWKQQLRDTNPFRLYRHKIGGRDGPGSNWNCKASAGEYLFYAAGIRDNLDFVETSLSMQGRFFNNPFGLYTEGPSVYDIFPRCWLGEMLYRGYDGPFAKKLETALRLGQLTSLFLQMPNGALYSGGRSSHHLWGDALQALCFEAACRHMVDDPAQHALAGVFKRAARRAYGAVDACRLPSGEFSVVRNRAPYSQQHGYERYSSHSQYNLLLGAILGLAYEAAATSEDLQERVTPAEAGRYVLELPHPFNRVIANCDGAAVNIALARGPGQFPVGLQVAEMAEVPFETCLLDGALADAAFFVPEKPAVSLGTGLSWREGENWLSLASASQHISHGVFLQQVEEADAIAFGIAYRDVEDQTVIIENYEIRAGEIRIDYSDSPVIKSHDVRLQWNLLESDGANPVTVKIDQGMVCSLKGDKGLTFHLPQAAEIKLSEERFGTRNGFARTVIVETPSPWLLIQGY